MFDVQSHKNNPTKIVETIFTFQGEEIKIDDNKYRQDLLQIIESKCLYYKQFLHFENYWLFKNKIFALKYLKNIPKFISN